MTPLGFPKKYRSDSAERVSFSYSSLSCDDAWYVVCYFVAVPKQPTPILTGEDLATFKKDIAVSSVNFYLFFGSATTLLHIIIISARS